VRRALARHNLAAPPELLLEVYLAGRYDDRARIWQRANFPVEGLARFSEDPDASVRRLAALDPQASPELIERLLDDPDLEVRRVAAGASRLPVRRIVELLADPELAEFAAANPSLPQERMALG